MSALSKSSTFFTSLSLALSLPFPACSFSLHSLDRVPLTRLTASPLLPHSWRQVINTVARRPKSYWLCFSGRLHKESLGRFCHCLFHPLALKPTIIAAKDKKLRTSSVCPQDRWNTKQQWMETAVALSTCNKDKVQPHVIRIPTTFRSFTGWDRTLVVLRYVPTGYLGDFIQISWIVYQMGNRYTFSCPTVEND